MKQDSIRQNQELVRCSDRDSLVRLVEEKCLRFNLVNCVTALQKLAKLGTEHHHSGRKGRDRGEQRTLTSLRDQTEECLRKDDAQTRHVSTLLWSLAKLQVRELLNLIPCILEAAKRLKPEWFKEQEISISIWALGKLQVQDHAQVVGEFVKGLLSTAKARRLSLGSQGISNTLYGLASVGSLLSDDVITPEILTYLLDDFASCLPKCNSQEMSNGLYGIAKLNVKHKALSTVLKALCSCIHTLGSNRSQPQHVANAFWAVCRMEEAHALPDGLGARLVDVVCEFASRFNEQEMTMCLWAASSLIGSGEEPDVQKKLLPCLAQQAAKQLDTMTAQQFAIACLNLAKLGDHSLSSVMQEKIPLITNECNEQDLDNLAAALARWETIDNKACLALVIQANHLLSDKSAEWPNRTLANLVLNLGKVLPPGIQANAAFEKLGKSLCALASKKDLTTFNARDLSNFAWGLVMLGVEKKSLLQRLGDVAANQLDQFNAQECSKMLYALNKAGAKCDAFEQAATTERVQQVQLNGIPKPILIKHMIGGGRNLQKTREDTGTTGATGGALWQDSNLLAEWLVACTRQCPKVLESVVGSDGAKTRGTSFWQGKTAVELGAGVGLCSIVGSCLGMRVTATDGDDQVLSLLKTNVKANTGVVEGQGKLRARRLVWGEKDFSLSDLKLDRKPDVILASGVVYGKDANVWKNLHKTIKKLASKDTLILMAHGNGAAPGVHQLGGAFYEKMRKRFDIIQMPLLDLDKSTYSGCQVHACIRTKKRKANEEDRMSSKNKKQKHL